MAFTLKQIEAFLWVNDLGSFRRAAERLNTTQPNISARLSGLENHLGGALLDRKGSEIFLTPLGRKVEPWTRKLLRDRDGLLMEAGNKNAFEGVLRLGVTELIAQTWLRSFMGQFVAEFPNYPIELTVDLSTNLSRELTERRLDLAFQNAPFSDGALAQVELGEYPMVWVAQPGHSADEIANLPIMCSARNTAGYRALAQKFPDDQDRFIPSSNLNVLVQMAMDGLGVAVVPEVMVQDAVGGGALRLLNRGWTPPPLAFFARYDDGIASPPTRRAIEIAQDLS